MPATTPHSNGLHPDYRIRLMEAADMPAIVEICKLVYPHDAPYTPQELAEHHLVFPQGQFVAQHIPTGEVAGAHFTLRLCMIDFHLDDSWDVLTAYGTFDDDNPVGHTLYCADIMVHPRHQHHSVARALTDISRELVRQEKLWRMVAGSRLSGYAQHKDQFTPQDYVDAVERGELVDPGGRPVRSSVTRRMSVVRSASGEGESPSCSSRARVKRSAGLRGQSAFLTTGNFGFCGGTNAQCCS